MLTIYLVTNIDSRPWSTAYQQIGFCEVGGILILKLFIIKKY